MHRLFVLKFSFSRGNGRILRGNHIGLIKVNGTANDIFFTSDTLVRLLSCQKLVSDEKNGDRISKRESELWIDWGNLELDV